MATIATNPYIDYSRCKPNILDRFWAKVDRSGSCWLWTGQKLPAGYGLFYLYSIKRESRVMTAHRFIDIAFNGDMDGDVVVMHTCDNPSCVRPSHLKRGSSKENTADMLKKKRRGYTGMQGTKHHKAKLTEEDVLYIRSSDESQKLLAERYGVSTVTIWHVRSGRGWKHLKGPE